MFLSQSMPCFGTHCQTLSSIDDEHIVTKSTMAPLPLPTATPVPTPIPVPIGERVANTVKQYLGVPYVWGGTTPNGFDCSGLVQYVYAQFGITVSRTSKEQSTNGWAVSRGELKEGDLVFFANNQGIHHVGVYVGDGQFIHAPETGDVVKITALSERNDYYCARRIVE